MQISKFLQFLFDLVDKLFDEGSKDLQFDESENLNEFCCAVNDMLLLFDVQKWVLCHLVHIRVPLGHQLVKNLQGLHLDVNRFLFEQFVELI